MIIKGSTIGSSFVLQITYLWFQYLEVYALGGTMHPTRVNLVVFLLPIVSTHLHVTSYLKLIYYRHVNAAV